MIVLTILVNFIIAVYCENEDTDLTDEKFCTDPRTMRKHGVNSEWADVYSCTRHRCQPGGRNLAIYTVGCKRVEAPESAIECEEVVEDTNMQFPFCCTRLRCLVVVRGEVWTRVLGQPWESLPAAPWSHMYKMKRPPPADGSFLKKGLDSEGPIYELANENAEQVAKALRSRRPEDPDNDLGGPAPDIVLALATTSEEKKPSSKAIERSKPYKVERARAMPEPEYAEYKENEIDDMDRTPITTEMPGLIPLSEETIPSDPETHQTPEERPNEGKVYEFDTLKWLQNEGHFLETPSTIEPHQLDSQPDKLQALVEAIGTQMRDIEHVVQKLNKPDDKEFAGKGHRSKYLRSSDITTEVPLFVRDKNGYFSDASNSVRRRSRPAEPSTYMAPVDNHRRKENIPVPIELSSEKLKKHSHKRKMHTRRKHRKLDKKKKFNKVVRSDEVENSVEDSKITVRR